MVGEAVAGESWESKATPQWRGGRGLTGSSPRILLVDSNDDQNDNPSDDQTTMEEGLVRPEEAIRRRHRIIMPWRRGHPLGVIPVSVVVRRCWAPGKSWRGDVSHGFSFPDLAWAAENPVRRRRARSARLGLTRNDG